MDTPSLGSPGSSCGGGMELPHSAPHAASQSVQASAEAAVLRFGGSFDEQHPRRMPAENMHVVRSLEALWAGVAC